MITYPQQFLDVFHWLIRSSFHATILLMIILLVRAVVKKKFRFRMVYWLWMLLLLRLIWPLNVQTTFSVFNLIPQQAAPEHYFTTPAAEEPTVSVPLSGDKLVSPSNMSAQPAETAPSDVSASNEAQSAPIQTLPLAVAKTPTPFNWRQALCTVWLVGVVLMGGYVLFCNFRLWRIVKRQRLVTRQEILDLLEDCKGQLSLQTVIGVVETDKVKTPCLFGYLRPRLLLPVGTLDELTAEQLRYVFIHELAHLKRHDIFIGWLMAAVQVLHWFNPAIWFAMAQISTDRELACDELALSTLKENEPQLYGSTILTFLERFSRQQTLPAMAGIAENQSLLRRRLTMIATFKNKKASIIPALAILLLLAATTFTSARTVWEIDEHIFLKTDRGKVAVIQTPLSENDYTTILRFDDNNYGAAGWYDVSLKVATEQETNNIRIKAYIDGISDLVFKGNTVYWHHRDWAVPGRHDENDYPTMINDIQWHPKWPEEQRNLLEPRGEQKSDIFTLPFELPQTEIAVALEMTEKKVNPYRESFSSSAKESVQWSDDLESGSLHKWDSTAGTPTITTSDTHSGDYAVELNATLKGSVEQGKRIEDTILKLFPETAETAVVEAWVKPIEWTNAFSDIHFTFLTNTENIHEGVGKFWMWGPNHGYYCDLTKQERIFSHNLPLNIWTKLKIEYNTENNGTIKYYENDQLQLTIPNSGIGIKGFFLKAGIYNGPVRFLVDDILYKISPMKAEMLSPEKLVGTWRGTAIDKPEDGGSKNDFQLLLMIQNEQLAGSATGSFVRDNYCELRNLIIDGRALCFEVDSRIENLQMKVFLNLKDGKLQGEGIPINFIEDRCDIVLTKIKRPRTSAGRRIPVGYGGGEFGGGRRVTRSRSMFSGIGPEMMPTMQKQIDSSNLQSVIDEAHSGANIHIPAGIYDQPIRISKSLMLSGNPGETVFKVTANEPAILIDTKGKGKVQIKGLTIQWQLATSDKNEMPFAVAVKDTKAIIENCTFYPLGNPQRSPVAIRAMGFSEMDIFNCDFTGFDYVVCYGEGTKGRMAGCFIRDCGHQGVILYSGAQAEIVRNIITGSKYHAVRTTGGKLDMWHNLIINNKNRGVYLGNKSGSGKIVNNLLIGNATGIDGMSACQFSVQNNVILKSTYAAIAARPYSLLGIEGNVLSDNPRGIIIHQEEGKSDTIRSKFGKNVFWKNQTNIELQTTDLSDENIEMIEQEPDFIEPDNGNFTLADPAFERMGLSDPKVIFDLWQKYKEKK